MALILALFCLAGCVHKTFKSEGEDFADDFAAVANQQLLLNIARLANDEPAYFIQLGAFSAGYSYSANISPVGAGSAYTRNFGAATTIVDPAIANSSVALAPSAGFGYMETPTFNFTPLSGDAVMKALFAPLPDNVFSIIFSTWHADAALRTAVASIEVVPPTLSAASDSAVLTVTGAPAPAHPMPPVRPPDPEAGTSRPAFSRQPADATWPTDTDAVSFEVKADEKLAVAYQWQSSDDSGWHWEAVSDGPAKDGPTYSGASTAKLSIYRVVAGMDKYRYRCVATVKKGQIKSLVWRNVPNPGDRYNQYALFLALAYELRKAQEEKIFPPTYPSDAEKALEEKAEKAAKSDAVTVYDVKLPDLISAQGSNYTVENGDPGAGGGSHHAYSTYKNPPSPSDTFAAQFPDESLLANYPLLHWIVLNRWHIRCNLRSFDNILYSVAKEDQSFGELIPEAGKEIEDKRASVREFLSALCLEHSDRNAKFLPTVTIDACPDEVRDEQGACIRITVQGDGLPEDFKARPILRLTRYKADYSLVKLRHPLHGAGNVPYVVGDLAREEGYDPKVTPSVRNQTEFTLLSYIFNQASIDSSKLPVQQLIEVH